METYREFLNRISSFEKEELCLGDGYFSVNPSLHSKVSEDGSFRPFYGDTVVFDLDEATKERLSEVIKRLYDCSGECFCERLIPSSLHMTLHDLSNSPLLGSVAEEIFFNGIRVSEIRKELKREKIRMKTGNIFNMVNTSIVLGLYPTDEKEYGKLMNLYSLFDGIKPLSYSLTPHITLAYYNPRGFGEEAALRLKSTVFSLNREAAFEITLNTEHLLYQKFTGMNDYTNIIRFA